MYNTYSAFPGNKYVVVPTTFPVGQVQKPIPFQTISGYPLQGQATMSRPQILIPVSQTPSIGTYQTLTPFTLLSQKSTNQTPRIKLLDDSQTTIPTLSARTSSRYAQDYCARAQVKEQPPADDFCMVPINKPYTQETPFPETVASCPPSYRSNKPVLKQEWSWCSTAWSTISMICFVSFCGFFGLVYALFSYMDYKAGDNKGYRYKNKMSCICASVGIILSILGALAVVFIFIIYHQDLRSVLSKVNYNGPFWEQQ